MKNFNSELESKDVFEYLTDNWVEIPNTIFSIQINQKQRIENILWDNKISDLIILLISYGLIKISENLWNQFEREKEIKILDVNSKKLWNKLLNLWAKKIFEGRIIDTYFDTENKDLKNWTSNWWNKSSIRIRYKTNLWEQSWKYYCTIKRRDKQSKESLLRDCYEEEFEIFNPIIFYKLLLKFGLKEYKLKVKNRVWYSLDNKKIKFDFDRYENIPELLEIEAENSKEALNYIKKLGLEDKDTLNWGSSSLFKHYWLEIKKFF